MYSPDNYGNTVRTLAGLAEYINHMDDAFGLDNVMAIELLNEPWAHLVSGRAGSCWVDSWGFPQSREAYHANVSQALLSRERSRSPMRVSCQDSKCRRVVFVIVDPPVRSSKMHAS